MDGKDRLSALSDNLLRRILHLVPSKEAASTSVLSRRWGSLWRSCGAVNLTVRVIPGSTRMYGESKEKRRKAEVALASSHEAFVRAAETALAAAEAPVTRLTLRLDSEHNSDAINDFLRHGKDWSTKADVVDDLLSHPAARSVEELRVALVEATDACFFSSTEFTHAMGIHKVVSPPSAKALRVLDLTRCDLAPAAPDAFPRLATLLLRLCSAHPTDLQAFLDAAPELATVHLESVCFTLRGHDEYMPVHQYDDDDGTTAAEAPVPVVRLCFRAVTTLVLALCGFKGPGSWAIEIDAPRLRSFVYKGLLRRFLLTSSAPDMARVDLHFLDDTDKRHRGRGYQHGYDMERTRVLFWQFVQNFTNARALRLKVDHDLKQIAAIGKARRGELLCLFPRTECLELQGVHRPTSKTAGMAIANLLHCCPLLHELTLKLGTVPFLESKDGLDYDKSIDRFRSRNRRTVIAMEDASGDRYDDVPDGIPGLSGRSFACMQSSLRRVGLKFRLGDSSSSCLGVRLIKFFAENAMVVEEICVDSGNRKLYQHLNLGVERWITKARFEHKNLAEGSWKFSKIPSVSVDSTTEFGKSTGRSTTGFTVLPLQR